MGEKMTVSIHDGTFADVPIIRKFSAFGFDFAVHHAFEGLRRVSIRPLPSKRHLQYQKYPQAGISCMDMNLIADPKRKPTQREHWKRTDPRLSARQFVIIAICLSRRKLHDLYA